MLDGVMLLWFILATGAVLFVAIDIRTTPESPVLKWGFCAGHRLHRMVAAFLYVLGCREPLPGTHEQYVAAANDRLHGFLPFAGTRSGDKVAPGAANCRVVDKA